ncbi:PREDICTED: pentatricopeptide repeat-containing protein At4g31070, mitochondrial [Tarenaya hassleriana]|uniref:pentatricopeptide repeat-containing protein At4g31070, mitochondrial n=1 Tax=Tarenaya hassleriana TaxID=28532 RepID=UPI00053C7A56|nr:PREDICTED: pentatricopeptide repeat-containing protein At4g31070, mitochondrial [Tarenaya hassleriana]
MARPFSALSFHELGNKLKALVSEQQYCEALKLFKLKIHPLGINGFLPILPSIVKACSFQPDSLLGAQIHSVCLKSASDCDTVVTNSLISMYTKLCNMDSARKVFDEMPQRDTISYCSIVNSYCQGGFLSEALKLLKEMYFHGLVPKPELVAAVLSLCTRMGSGQTARMLHALVLVDERMQGSIVLSTALVDMYLKFHELKTAFHVFNRMEEKNEVSWTAMISSCVADHNYGMGIDLFIAMQRENVRPNHATLLSILPACVEIGSGLRRLKEIHGFSFRQGFNSDNHLTTALMTVYCRCGNAILSRLLFERSKVRDVVMWSSMIGGYAETGDSAEAMNLFSRMRKEGIKPNSVTLLAAVSACTHLASLNHAYGIHCHILKNGFNYDLSLSNALINMYSKCGGLVSAHKVFDELGVKDLVSWSSMINAYGLHGRGSDALELFQVMTERGMEIDAMAFLAILSACNYSGLIEEAQNLFMQAVECNKVPLTVEHYACYVNLLGRSGKIEDAFEAIKDMPMKSSPKIWSSLLSACKIHGKLNVAGTMLANQLMESEPDNPANYALLSNIHTESGDAHGAEQVRRIMQKRGLNKCYGFSRIEL